MRTFTGKVVKAPLEHLTPARRDGSGIVFPPSGSDRLVCGHCGKTVEEDVHVDTSVPQGFECCFCGAQNTLLP